MTLRVKRMVRVATGARPNPHRGSRRISVFIGLDGPTIRRWIRIPIREDLGIARGRAPDWPSNDGPLRVARRTKGELGEFRV